MSAPTSAAVYLGDGLYVETEDGMVKLMAFDGRVTTNVVYLEAEVLASFERWVAAGRLSSRGGK